MSDKVEINEELLENVSGGVRGDGKPIRKQAEKTEDSIIKNAQKKIAETTKVGKILKDTNDQKLTATTII